MRSKKIIILISLFLFFSTQNKLAAQEENKYKKELKKFLTFARDSIFIYHDTLTVKEYLLNKNLFQGLVLAGKIGLTKDEKAELIKNINTDTSKYYFPTNFLKKTKYVDESKKVFIQLSKPIFLRSYLLCVFCYSSDDSEKTYLCKKEKGKWGVVEIIGRIDNY